MSHICMLAHSYFPQNPRTRVQAVSMAAAGHEVQMICPRAPGEPAREVYRGVDVVRLPVTRDRSRGFSGYLFEYARFFLLARNALARSEAASHFDVVVAHNIPEQLVYAAKPARDNGAAVVLDVHDPLPELFGEKFGVPDDSMVVRTLKRLELSACLYADHVFVATDPLKDRLTAMGFPAERATPILNSPQPREASGNGHEPFVIVYHGSILERYGLETVLYALAKSLEAAPEIELHVFGSDVDDAYELRLKQIAKELEIDGHVAFSGYLAPLALQRALDGADLGIVCMRRPSHIDLAYPMKMFEYLACGVPVLSVRTAALESLFGDGQVTFYEESDIDDLSAAITGIARGRTTARSLPNRPGTLASELSWPEQERRYLEKIEELTNGQQSRQTAEVARA